MDTDENAGPRNDRDDTDDGPWAGTKVITTEDIEAISSYLAKSGATLLLKALLDNDARFIELEEDLPLSEATISNRLKEGRKLGLIEFHYNAKGQKLHTLQTSGEVIADWLVRTDLPRIKEEIRRLEAEYEEKRRGFEEHLKENQEDLDQDIKSNITR